ncbi:hypothetical protein ACTQ1N_02130 [Porcincola sp. LCP21S3_C12]|uniref:hypothetical protein n=1 Tax=Porcincola sp. LCP21S3_C12 TaxID=3438798 RepID=UPI003F9DBF25
MNERWTLNVEDFGKIEKASVRIASLICFVGDNNSGKCYLLSLIWGILILGRTVFQRHHRKVKHTSDVKVGCAAILVKKHSLARKSSQCMLNGLIPSSWRTGRILSGGFSMLTYI